MQTTWQWQPHKWKSTRGNPTARARILEALNPIPNNKPGETVPNLSVSTVNAPSLSRRIENKGTEAAGAFKSSSKLLRSPVLEKPAGQPSTREDDKLQDAAKRQRDPGSPTGGQRTASAKRPKADKELTGPEQLAEIGALLDEVLHLTSVMQVRHINVTMKAMFSRVKSLQEGAVISFNQVGDSHQQKETTECNKCKGPLRNSESKEQQTPVCLQKDNAAQTEFWRNATQGPMVTSAVQTDPWRRLSQPGTVLDGGEPPTSPAQSSARRAPAGSQQKKKRNPHEEHAKKRDPRGKTAAGGSAGKDDGKDATTAWRKAAPKKRARKPHRPDALIVEANGKTYSEVLAMVTRRDDGKLQSLSTRLNKVRRTANGNLLLELNRSKDTSTEEIKESLEAVLGEATAARALSENARTRTVVISDLDPLVEAVDVTKALVDQFAVNAESVKLRSLRPSHRDTQTAVVGLPSRDAEAVLCKGKIKLGWSICKVKERDSQPRCYKCLEIGHIAIKCHTKVDRSGRNEVEEPPSRKQAVSSRRKKSRSQTPRMEVIQINLNHCRAAQDLLLQSARESKADLAVISEPYKVKDDGDWITDTSGKAAIWLCRRNGKSFLDVHKGSGFVRARIGEMWVYSCYLAPSLSTTDFSHALDTIAFDARGRYPAISQATSTHVTLLNEGTQETFNRAGAGSIIDLTFVNSALAQRSHWRIGDFFTASDHEAILCTVGTRPGPETRNRAVKGYRQETLNAEAMSRCLADMHCSTEADANTNADAIAASLEDACRTGMLMRKPYSRDHEPVPWWNSEIATLRRICLRARRAFQRSRRTDRAEAAHVAFKQAKRTLKHAILDSKRECFLKLCDAAEQDPCGGAYRLVVKRVSAGSRSPTDPETLSDIVRTLFPSGSAKESEQHETAPTWEIEEVTEAEVAEAGRSLQNNKAPGPDAVPNRAMKLALGLRPGTFADLYNACLREGTFPRRWKAQKLLLLNKPGKPPGEASSYRPICLLDTVGKVFEKLISKRLNLAVDAAGGLSTAQFAAEAIRGKRWKGGTKKYCLLVTLDIKNAFNTANWTRIMQALRRLRIPEYLTRIVDSYLGERVLLFDTSDGPKEYFVTAGVRRSAEASHACKRPRDWLRGRRRHHDRGQDDSRSGGHGKHCGEEGGVMALTCRAPTRGT
ncbi:uncharacterized protein [Drosophila suzukii]|uniref:Retrovirus-related Pol polyprotein from type-1 retrotransposable element R1 n=1 Tax=Drosophila suzukii TaxID=28584 RepID=A0ABM4TNB8_DROSZ